MTPFDPSEQSRERIEPTESKDRPSGAQCRVAFGLSYDGSCFHGFAPQPGIRTVAGAFCAVLSELVNAEITVTCAGRTDVGVHATGQIVHADLDAHLIASRFHVDPTVGSPIASLGRALSSRLHPDVALWNCVVMPPAFDARRAATSRRYRYQIDVDGRAAPLRRRVAWQFDQPLDLSLLRTAAEKLLGEHDFTAFCRKPTDRPCASLVRRILDVSWQQDAPGEFAFEIEANAFCHQMVRAIVGTLVAVGVRKIHPNAVEVALGQKDRTAMAPIAPAQGLCLVKVNYPTSFTTLLETSSLGA